MNKQLGPDDEPQGSGTVVAVHWGDYRRQEVWISSGSNIGAWYCLGGEFGRPKVAIDPRSELEKIPLFGRETWKPAPGEIPLHPHWEDVLARGPVTLLSAASSEEYAQGWENGRRRMLEQIEQLRDDEDVPPGHGWRSVSEDEGDDE